MRNTLRSNKKKEVLRRLEEERFERRLRSSEKRRGRLRRVSGYRRSRYQVTERGRISRDTGWVDLRLPDTLDLINQFEETVEFISAIRRNALTWRRKVRLLFDEVKVIRPAALLMLLAQIQECWLLQGPHHVTGTYPTDSRLERMMDATGFFKLLGVASRVAPKKQSKRSVEYIEFISDVRMERGAARKLRESLLSDGMSMNIVARKKLFRAISEAMLNEKWPRKFEQHDKWKLRA